MKERGDRNRKIAKERKIYLKRQREETEIEMEKAKEKWREGKALKHIQ